MKTHPSMGAAVGAAMEHNARTAAQRPPAGAATRSAGDPVVVCDDRLVGLIDRLGNLPGLEPVEQAIEAGRLMDEIRPALAAVRHAAVYKATRKQTWPQVAEQLGITRRAVNRIITLYLAAAREASDTEVRSDGR